MNSTHMRARGAAVRSMIAASLLGLLAAWGTGCGQRGPLYLPDTDPGASEVAAAESATPEDGTADEQRADGEERE